MAKLLTSKQAEFIVFRKIKKDDIIISYGGFDILDENGNEKFLPFVKSGYKPHKMLIKEIKDFDVYFRFTNDYIEKNIFKTQISNIERRITEEILFIILFIAPFMVIYNGIKFLLNLITRNKYK